MMLYLTIEDSPDRIRDRNRNHLMIYDLYLYTEKLVNALGSSSKPLCRADSMMLNARGFVEESASGYAVDLWWLVR